MTAQTVETDVHDTDDEEVVEHEPRGYSLLTRLGAELVGTFALVLAILLVAGYGNLTTSLGTLPVGIAAGLAVVAVVSALGHVSGAHLNPAVSLGSALAGRLGWGELLPYVVAQVLGGVLAGALLAALYPEGLQEATGGTGGREAFVSEVANGFGEHSPLAVASQGLVSFTTTQALLLEAVATAVLVGVTVAIGRRAAAIAPVAIGAAYAAAVLVTAPVTNGGVNPARSTATAFFAESWALPQLWLFWVGPLLGAAIAGLVLLLTGGADAEAEPAWADEDDDEDEDDDVAVPEAGAPDDDDDHVRTVDDLDRADPADPATAVAPTADQVDEDDDVAGAASVELHDLPDDQTDDGDTAARPTRG